MFADFILAIFKNITIFICVNPCHPRYLRSEDMPNGILCAALKMPALTAAGLKIQQDVAIVI